MLQTKGISKLKYISDTAQNLLSGSYGVRAEVEVGHGYAGTVLRCALLNGRGHNANPHSDTKGRMVVGAEYVAVKVMAKSKIKAKVAESEAKLLKYSKGENVLAYMTAVECVDSYVIVTEFCGRGDLHGMLGRMDKGHFMAREYLLGVASGLESLHSKFIAHSDIKMKNILIADNNVPKIADFGFATKFSSLSDTTSVCHGTRDYWAPEMCVQYPQFDPFKADIYALGVTFVGVCEKKPIKKSHDNIHSIVGRFDDVHQRALFQGMLKIKPEDRFTLAQVKSNVWVRACITPPPTP